MSYLYLLVGSNGGGFKIGVSVDPSQRMAALPQEFDIAKSFQIKFGVKNAYRVEKTLHFLFRKYHISKERCDGYTEWFSMDCFEDVHDFISSQRDLLEWTHFEPIPRPSMPIVKSIQATDEERANRKAAMELKKQKQHLRCYENNKHVVEKFAGWIELLKERDALIGKFYTRHYNDRITHMAMRWMPCSQPQDFDFYQFPLRFLNDRGREFEMRIINCYLDHPDSTHKDYRFATYPEDGFLDPGRFVDYGPYPHGKMLQSVHNVIDSIPLVPTSLLTGVFEQFDKAFQCRWSGRRAQLWDLSA